MEPALGSHPLDSRSGEKKIQNHSFFLIFLKKFKGKGAVIFNGRGAFS